MSLDVHIAGFNEGCGEGRCLCTNAVGCDKEDHYGCLWCCLSSTKHRGVSLLAGNPASDAPCDLLSSSTLALLKGVWQEHIDECEQLERFDIVISVCGAGFGTALLSAISASHSIIVPLSDWSQGSELVSILYGSHDMRGRSADKPIDMFVPMTKGRVARGAVKLTKKVPDVPIFGEVIDQQEIIVQSLRDGRTLVDYYPCAKVTRKIHGLIARLLEKESHAGVRDELLARLALPSGVKHRGYRRRAHAKRKQAQESPAPS